MRIGVKVSRWSGMVNEYVHATQYTMNTADFRLKHWAVFATLSQ